MAAEEARKLFVAGLPDTFTEDILRQLFEATGGKVVEVSLPKDRATGRPRGFGFVTLATPAEAQTARDSLDGSMHMGRSISVRPFQAEPPKRDGGGMGGPPGAPRPHDRGANTNAQDRTLYVGNLPYDTSQAEVEALFGERGLGPVARVSLPMDDDGRKRGFGFVTMPTPESANAAIDALRGADLRGRSLIINLAYPRDARPPREGGGPPPQGGRPFNSGPGPGGGGFGPPPDRFSSPAPGGGGPPGGSSGPRPGPGGGPPKRATDWKRKKSPEGEGRSKSWDRERSGRSYDRDDDWDE